jgi:tRNA C32,U32 (ribose-2'-O)-methylase TrmJ
MMMMKMMMKTLLIFDLRHQKNDLAVVVAAVAVVAFFSRVYLSFEEALKDRDAFHTTWARASTVPGTAAS